MTLLEISFRIMAASAESVLTVHGCDDEERLVYVGGLDRERMDGITASLRAAGFEVREHHNPEMQGVHARNICNRGRSGRGVQLEISAGLRRTMFKDFTREGTQTTTSDFEAFVAAVRRAIMP